MPTTSTGMLFSALSDGKDIQSSRTSPFKMRKWFKRMEWCDRSCGNGIFNGGRLFSSTIIFQVRLLCLTSANSADKWQRFLRFLFNYAVDCWAVWALTIHSGLMQDILTSSGHLIVVVNTIFRYLRTWKLTDVKQICLHIKRQLEHQCLRVRF